MRTRPSFGVEPPHRPQETQEPHPRGSVVSRQVNPRRGGPGDLTVAPDLVRLGLDLERGHGEEYPGSGER